MQPAYHKQFSTLQVEQIGILLPTLSVCTKKYCMGILGINVVYGFFMIFYYIIHLALRWNKTN